MARARVITGVGRGENPVDGEVITVQLGLRAGAVAYAGAEGIMTGRTTLDGLWRLRGDTGHRCQQR